MDVPLMLGTTTALALMAGSVLSLAAAEAADAAPRCERSDVVIFAIPPARTAAFHTAVARRIVEDGFGCATAAVGGPTRLLGAALAEGDAHVVMEVWTDAVPPSIAAGLADGAIVRLGTTVPDASVGWYVPRTAVIGPDAPAAGLRAMADLRAHSAVFADPEEPGKGRFLNCVIGWACEARNTRTLAAHGLDEAFANVRPGSHAALVEQVEEAIALGEPVLFAYWSPSALVARHDLVRLAEPATGAPPEAAAVEALGNAAFVSEAPALATFIGRYSLSAAATNAAIAGLARGRETADEAAVRFLDRHPEIWTAWVPGDVAARVEAGLDLAAAASGGER